MITYKRYEYSKNKDFIKEVYLKAFPKSERFPFWLLMRCSKENNVHLECILNDDQPIGMQFTVEYDDITYLMYFAIEDKCRNNGLGSKALQNVVVRNENVLLCIERVNEINDIKSRRKKFYLRNGFYETGCFIEDSGVEYEFLSSKKNFKVSKGTLQNRYLKMSNNKFIKHIIASTFDVNNIKFIA